MKTDSRSKVLKAKKQIETKCCVVLCCVREEGLAYVNAIIQVNIPTGFLNYTICYLSFYIAMYRYWLVSPNTAGINERGTARANDGKVEIISYGWENGEGFRFYRSKFRKNNFKNHSVGQNFHCIIKFESTPVLCKGSWSRDADSGCTFCGRERLIPGVQSSPSTLVVHRLVSFSTDVYDTAML